MFLRLHLVCQISTVLAFTVTPHKGGAVEDGVKVAKGALMGYSCEVCFVGAMFPAGEGLAIPECAACAVNVSQHVEKTPEAEDADHGLQARDCWICVTASVLGTTEGLATSECASCAVALTEIAKGKESKSNDGSVAAKVSQIVWELAPSKTTLAKHAKKFSQGGMCYLLGPFVCKLEGYCSEELEQFGYC